MPASPFLLLCPFPFIRLLGSFARMLRGWMETHELAADSPARQHTDPYY